MQNITIIKLGDRTSSITIDFSALIGLTKVDWGDGEISTDNFIHTYSQNDGEVELKLYDVIYFPDKWDLNQEQEFNKCDYIEIEFGHGVKKIGSHTFCYDIPFSNLILSNTIEWIGSAFQGINLQVEELRIPKSVVRIENGAFDGYGIGIKKLIIEGAPSIGTAFYANNSKYNIYCLSLTPLSFYAIKDSWMFHKIYVPEEAYDEYVEQLCIQTGFPKDYLIPVQPKYITVAGLSAYHERLIALIAESNSSKIEWLVVN